MFHVQLSGKGFSINVASTYNLSVDEVNQRFVDPWELGTHIVLSGKTFDPTDSEIRVYEAGELDDEQKRGPTAWIAVMEAGTDVTDEFIKVPAGSKSREADTDESGADPRRVAVVHGRDTAATDWLFDYLRRIDLRPLEWSELVRATGSAAPSNRRVVEQLFKQAIVVVVLVTPDEVCRLHPLLTPDPDPAGDGAWRSQPRANVLLEAGMALAIYPERTVFVEIGSEQMLPSDLDGVNNVRLDGTAGPLHLLAERLETAGCAVRRAGEDWLSTEVVAALSARTRLPDLGHVST